VRRARPKLDRALLEGQGRGTAARRTLHALLRGARGPLPLEQALSFALDIAAWTWQTTRLAARLKRPRSRPTT
jgi:hypothetical protein